MFICFIFSKRVSIFLSILNDKKARIFVDKVPGYLRPSSRSESWKSHYMTITVSVRPNPRQQYIQTTKVSAFGSGFVVSYSVFGHNHVSRNYMIIISTG